MLPPLAAAVALVALDRVVVRPRGLLLAVRGPVDATEDVLDLRRLLVAEGLEVGLLVGHLATSFRRR